MENLVMQCSLNQFYKGKKIFITGHTGFKGSWLAAWLQVTGADVCGYSLPPQTDPSHFILLKPPTKNFFSDINDLPALREAINSFQPEIVFHLAAQPLVRYSYENPIETFETNVMGTLKVLEVCRQCSSVRAVVCVTSDKVYRNENQNKAFKEEDALGGSDPYSASKSVTEIVAQSFRNSFLKNNSLYALATARAGNVIGGGDWAEDRLIPDMMRAASTGTKVVIRNSNHIRPWQHVLESVSAYLVLGRALIENAPVASEAWNFGPLKEENISVREIVESCTKLWNRIVPQYSDQEDELTESSFLSIDSSKAAAKLQWNPVWNTGEAVANTISWYKNFYEVKKIQTLEEIENYIVGAAVRKIKWAQS